jgi:hypothetical protein
MPSPWTSSTASPIPVSQINALPVLNQQQYLAPDGADTVIISKNTLKYWSPAALGFTAKQPLLVGGQYPMTTPWLDVAPCQFFLLTLLRSIPGGDVGALSQFLYCLLQYKQGPGDVPPPFDISFGVNLFETIAIQFPALAGAAVQRYTMQLCPNTGVGSSMHNVSLVQGSMVRFCFDAQAAPSVLDHSTYSLSIFGSS